MTALLSCPTLVRKALRFTHELSFFFLFFYQSTALSSRVVDGHPLYSGGSVVDKASTIGREISPTPPLIFTGGSKSAKFGVASTSLNYEPPVFKNAARFAKFGEVGCAHH